MLGWLIAALGTAIVVTAVVILITLLLERIDRDLFGLSWLRCYRPALLWFAVVVVAATLWGARHPLSNCQSECIGPPQFSLLNHLSAGLTGAFRSIVVAVPVAALLALGRRLFQSTG